jgi:hypothetical protein
LPSESAHLFRAGAIEYDCTGGTGTFQLWTDLPGNVLTLRESKDLAATSGRQVYEFPLSGATKGRLARAKVLPPSAGRIILYRVGLYVRRLGRQANDWHWIWLNVAGSDDQPRPLQIPIPPTSDYVQIKAPIPQTGEYQQIKAPIPPRDDSYRPVKLPIEPSDDAQRWVDLPTDEDLDR